MGHLYSLVFPNGKRYIGITTKTTEKRFLSHQKAAAKGLKFPLYEAWRKYGPPTCTTLAVLEDRELAETEKRAISVFNTLVPHGLNISAGGDLTPMRHPEARKKVSEAMKGLWKDPAQVKRFVDGMRGNKNRKGKPNSKEHSEKVSAALKGKPFTESHKQALRDAWVKRKQKGLGVPWNKKGTQHG